MQEITSKLTPESELVRAEQTARTHSEEIHDRVVQANELLAGNPTALELQDEIRYWRSLSQDYARQRELLTSRAAELEQQIGLLDEQQSEWQATWDQIRLRQGIETVVERVRNELDAIRATRAQTQKQLNLMLTLQNQISRMDQQISDLRSRVQEAQEKEHRRLLERDSRPLWQVRELRNLEQGFHAGFHRTVDRSLVSAEEFLLSHKFRLIGLLGVYLLTLFGSIKLRRYLDQGTKMEGLAQASKTLASPFSIALLAVLVGTVGFMATAPMSIVFILYLLYLIPVLRLLSPLLEPRLRSFLYVLGVFHTLQGMYLLITLPPPLRREILALLTLTALISFGWLARPSRMRELSKIGRGLTWLKLGIRLGLVLVALSLCANIAGYVSLAQILGLTALLGAFTGVSLYCTAQVLMLMLNAALHSGWRQSLLEVQVQKVELWSRRGLILISLFLWVIAVLRMLTVYEKVVGGISSVLAYPIGLERVHISLGAILSFVLILIGGYAFAKLITFALAKLLLSRFPLQRGLPFAISKVSYYVLLVLVFIAALTNAGMELNKFTLITGAVGVGVGFGLQNTVNNFVCGLILLFERPIRAGDTVEVSGLIGRVRRIGARSSTIYTFQDAEVIVPNSDFISKEVVNWTLSSSRRRVDIPVGVAYGTQPERMLSLLADVAAAQSGVARDPKPEAYFLGFGDSALNFELRFWTYQEAWFRLKSDVAVGIVKALCDAGIEIPFPQRDLHLRGVSTTLGEALVGDSLQNTSSIGAGKADGLEAMLQLASQRQKKSKGG